MPGNALDNPSVDRLMAALLEHDAHPYDLAARLPSRVSRATVYDLVRTLAAVGWVARVGVAREGARPERTTYRLTDEGRAELRRRLDAQVRGVRREESAFQIAVSHLGVLGRRGAAAALAERADRLRARIEKDTLALGDAVSLVPRLFVLEADYALHQSRAELDWVEGLRAAIADGSLTWPRRRR